MKGQSRARLDARHSKVCPCVVTSDLSKTRRGNYVFLSQVADHSPTHVHVYRDGRLVVKWDLERGREIKGHASPRVRELIAELIEEGRL